MKAFDSGSYLLLKGLPLFAKRKYEEIDAWKEDKKV